MVSFCKNARIVCCKKHACFRIVIPITNIVQSRLLVKHIPAIPKRLHLAQRLRQLTGTPQRRTPRIVAVSDDGIAILIHDCDRFLGMDSIRYMKRFFLLLRKFLLPARRRLVRWAQDATGWAKNVTLQMHLA